jgi:hypothetical protein
MDLGLAGSKAIVTGGSKGMGLATDSEPVGVQGMLDIEGYRVDLDRVRSLGLALESFPKLMSYSRLKCHPNVTNDK